MSGWLWNASSIHYHNKKKRCSGWWCQFLLKVHVPSTKTCSEGPSFLSVLIPSNERTCKHKYFFKIHGYFSLQNWSHSFVQNWPVQIVRDEIRAHFGTNSFMIFFSVFSLWEPFVGVCNQSWDMHAHRLLPLVVVRQATDF